MRKYGPPTSRNAVVGFAKTLEGKLSYSQSVRNPDKGSADCSSFVAYCYKKVIGLDVGSNTDEQIKKGVEVDTSTSSSRVPNTKKLKPGDLLFYRNPSSGHSRGAGHVEMYIGDGIVLGHGGGKGPKRKNALTYRTDNSKGNYYICARRYINTGDWFEIDKKYIKDAEESVGDEYYGENAYSSDGAPTVIWAQREARCASEVINSAPDMTYDGFCIYADGRDITSYTGDITLSDTIDGICATLTFSIGKTDNAYLQDLIYNPPIGALVTVGNGKEMFLGVITDIDDGDLYKNSYTASDIGFYLKTEETYQFSDIRADEAIKTIFADLSIPLHYICDMPALVTNVYFDKAVSEIIKDIFEVSGGGYVLDAVPDGIRVYREGEFETEPLYTAAKNVPAVNAFLTAHDMSHTQSIQGMYNAVKAVSSENNVYTELKTAFNSDSIQEYGFMQKIVSVDTQKENVDEVCASKLAELCCQEESFGISIYCDMSTRVRSGTAVVYGARRYIVTSASHKVMDGGAHFESTLELKGEGNIV